MPKPEAKEIPIALLREYLDYNRETGIFTWKKRPSPWSRARVGDVAGSSEKYKRVDVQRQHYSLHRIAFAFEHGWCPLTVDHVDGDTHNNRSDNLRAATQKQQQRNRAAKGYSLAPKRRHVLQDGTVVYYERRKKYQSSITVNGKAIWLGNYHTKQEAIDAYEKATLKHFGVFARSAGRLQSA